MAAILRVGPVRMPRRQASGLVVGYDRRAVMGATASDVYRLSRVEYDRAVEAGAFEPDAKLELIDGELLAMTPEGSRHAAVIQLVAARLRQVFDSGFDVRVQHPLAAAEYSEPEPDVAVVPGTIRDYMDAHPTSAVLVVEVSNESLHRDRTLKQRLYAASAIPEYWIVALPDHRLEVYRNPAGETATRASPSTQPATASHHSLAPMHRSSSTICSPDCSSRPYVPGGGRHAGELQQHLELGVRQRVNDVADGQVDQAGERLEAVVRGLVDVDPDHHGRDPTSRSAQTGPSGCRGAKRPVSWSATRSSSVSTTWPMRTSVPARPTMHSVMALRSPIRTVTGPARVVPLRRGEPEDLDDLEGQPQEGVRVDQAAHGCAADVGLGPVAAADERAIVRVLERDVGADVCHVGILWQSGLTNPHFHAAAADRRRGPGGGGTVSVSRVLRGRGSPTGGRGRPTRGPWGSFSLGAKRGGCASRRSRRCTWQPTSGRTPESASTVKEHLAAIRMLGDWLVVSQVLAVNPAAAVRGPKHVVTKGSTPVLSLAEVRRLLETTDAATLAGLRDRALLSMMLYSFARV